MSTSKHPAKAEPETPQSAEGHRLPLHVPSIYADQIVDVIYGINTTKIVLGVETGGKGQALAPVSALIVPTATLLTAVLKIASDFANPALVSETEQRYAAILKVMKDLGEVAAAAQAQQPGEDAAARSKPRGH